MHEMENRKGKRKDGEEGQGKIRLMVNPTTLAVSHA
jgi:hypothetical protein